MFTVVHAAVIAVTKNTGGKGDPHVEQIRSQHRSDHCADPTTVQIDHPDHFHGGTIHAVVTILPSRRTRPRKELARRTDQMTVQIDHTDRFHGVNIHTVVTIL